MAEVMSFVDFAHQYCGEGGVQWGFGIKGTTGGDEVKVLPDISKANSGISYYFLCPNGPHYANIVVRGSGGELQASPWSPSLAQIEFPIGTERPAGFEEGKANEVEEVTLVAFNLVPDADNEANIYAAVTYKKNDKTEVVIKPNYTHNNIIIEVLDAGIIEVQGSKPEGKNRVTPANFHHATKVGTGRGDTPFQIQTAGAGS